METFYVLLILLLIVLGVVILSRPSTKSVESLIYPIPIPGERPSLGDFLPTVGNTPTNGKYELEDSVYSPYINQAILCSGCVDNCMDLLIRRGESQGYEKDRYSCTLGCNLECNSNF